MVYYYMAAKHNLPSLPQNLSTFSFFPFQLTMALANYAKLNQMQQLMKTDRHVPTMSDDNVLVKKIMAEHNPDGLEHDIKPLLHLVEDILKHATLSSEGVSMV